MADIAFLLLIFFLVTTIFDEEKGLSIVLPEQGVEAEVSQKNILHLTIQPNGIVEIKRGESPQIQQARAADIGAIWRQEVSQNPNLIAAVKTAPSAPYRYMVDVLDQLQAVGAERVNLGLLEQ
jgi:biopolymer transport protein ExbD